MSDTTQRASSGSPYEDRYAFSRAVRVGQRVLVAGTAPIEPDGSCAPDVRAQARRCFAIIGAALTQVGADLDHVVRTRMYLTDPRDADLVGQVHAEVFARARPAATMVVVAALLDPAWRVEIEVEALIAQ